MLEVKLVGADTCPRYRMMRTLVLDEARRTGVPIRLVEETEAAGILEYHTLHLPMLFIGGEQVAAGNPPSRKMVQERLAQRREMDQMAAQEQDR
jgi:Thioredoxin domain